MLPINNEADSQTSKQRVHNASDESDNDDNNNNEQSELLPFEQLFSEWAKALKKEDVHLTAEDLLSYWPQMLTRPPKKLGTTLAVLRAALPEGTDIQCLLENSPRILGTAPLVLQNRLIKLQLATDGELQRMIVQAPSILTIPLDSVFANLRLVREHSRSAREYKSFLYTSASAIVRPPRYLQQASTAVRRGLERVIPDTMDAVELIKAKPQLLLVRGSWLGQRWRAIEEAVCLVDEWKEELENLIKDASSMPSSRTRTSSTTNDPLTILFERLGDGSDDIPSPPPPDWIHKDMDPHSLGVNAHQQSTKVKEIWELDEDSDDLDDNNEGEEGILPPQVVLKGRKAYSALGEALWMRPWRIQRLEYMAEQVPEEATQVSFISAMAVTLEQFEERFPEFHDWVKMKQEESGNFNRGNSERKEHEHDKLF
jgi:hypothetical protein